jgi:hypothetical protein
MYDSVEIGSEEDIEKIITLLSVAPPLHATVHSDCNCVCVRGVSGGDCEKALTDINLCLH